MIILAVILSYILGSIPVGYIMGRVLKGVDIRSCGSKNIGATNVFRVVSPWAGVAVLILDALKGAIPVIVFADLVLRWGQGVDPLLVRLALGLAAVCGHNWTIFLNFKGGKGVATTAGMLIGLSFKVPYLGLIVGLCLGVWVLVLVSTGFVSLSSIAAAAALPVFIALFRQPLELFIFGTMLSLFAIYRHKSNIRRLLRGEEAKIFPARRPR